MAEAIDWQTLTSVPTNFVALELRQQYTDLLFSVRWHDGSELFAYILFEHQSAPPKTRDGPMAFRLLRYQMRIREEWLSRNPDATSLPVIIPVVLYHGQQAWTAPRWFGDVLAVPPAVRPVLSPRLVQFEYLINDLSEISDEELRDRAYTAAVKLLALCYKHARTNPHFLTILGQWRDVVAEVLSAPVEPATTITNQIADDERHLDRVAAEARLIAADDDVAALRLGEELPETRAREEVISTAPIVHVVSSGLMGESHPRGHLAAPGRLDIEAELLLALVVLRAPAIGPDHQGLDGLAVHGGNNEPGA